MVNKFLAGKKKYSVFITTLLVALIEMFVVEPEAQKELMDFVPLGAMLLSGIVYLTVEGVNDLQREKTNTARAHSGSAASVAQVPYRSPVTQNGAVAILTPTDGQISPPGSFQPFDPQVFDERVELHAKQGYLEANDITRFFAAQDVGFATKCQHISQALAYWDYLVMRAHKAFEAKFGYPYEEADKHLKDDKTCPYYSVDSMARQKGADFWRMLLDLRRTIKCAEDLSQLAMSDIKWESKIAPPHDNLHSLGVLAGEVLNPSS